MKYLLLILFFSFSLPVLGQIPTPIISKFSSKVPRGRRTIKIISFNNSRPFLFKRLIGKGEASEKIPLGKDSQFLSGYQWDLIRQIFQGLGFEIDLTTFDKLPPDNILRGFKFDLGIGFTRNGTREKDYYFYSLFPLNRNSIGVFSTVVFRDNQISAKDFPRYKIGKIGGWTHGNRVDHIQLKAWNNQAKYSELLTLLYRNKIDLILGFKTQLWTEAKHSKRDKDLREILILDKITEHLISPNNSLKGKFFVDLFDDIMIELEKTTYLKNLKNKWQVFLD